jgi:hypothetical protein
MMAWHHFSYQYLVVLCVNLSLDTATYCVVRDIGRDLSGGGGMYSP